MYIQRHADQKQFDSFIHIWYSKQHQKCKLLPILGVGKRVEALFED